MSRDDLILMACQPDLSDRVRELLWRAIADERDDDASNVSRERAYVESQMAA